MLRNALTLKLYAGQALREVKECLSKIPTWDYIQLEGGRVYSGDFQGASVDRLVGR